MRRLRLDDFAFDEQYREHAKILKIEGVRVVNAFSEGGRLMVFYAINLNDARFMVDFGTGGPGDIDLYGMLPSLDNTKTLKEFLRGKGH